MGYHTAYTLQAGCDETTFIQIKERIKQLARYDGIFNGPCKWYEHEYHMRTVSREFPTVLLQLEGVGEEHPDIWVKYFLSGNMHAEKGKVVFPPFDAQKLK